MAEIDSIQAEQAVLGSVLIDHGCLRRIGALLREEDFAVELDRAIWHVLTEMDGEGRAIDGLTVAAALKDRGIGQDRENREYLAQLMYITPTSANAEEYAEIVRSTAVRRSVRKALADRGWTGFVTPVLAFASDSFDARRANLNGAVVINSNEIKTSFDTDRVVIPPAELDRLVSLMENCP